MTRDTGRDTIDPPDDAGHHRQALDYRQAAVRLRQQHRYEAASLAGMQELAIWRMRNDPLRAIDAAYDLAETFRALHRLHKVIDCGDEILHWAAQLADPRAFAAALRNLGLIHAECGHHELAITDYLTRAHDTLDTVPDTPATHRAELLAQIGRLHWTTGAEHTARHRFRQALALVTDIDEPAAEHLRALLSLPTGTLLPASALDTLDNIGHTARS